MFKRTFAVFLLFLLYDNGLGLQQRYNPNTDFLLHESGRNQQAPNPTPSKPQHTQQASWQQSYASQFPSLGQTTPQTHTTHGNARNPSSSGKRDYVAPQYPALRPTQGYTPTTSTIKSTLAPGSGGAKTSSDRRDYVAPQYPALGTQGNTQGKVKDLVNFYDGMGNKDTASKVPSYSSILQGGNSKSGTTTTKPLSYGSVVAGSSIPSSIATSGTTPAVSFTSPQKPTVPAGSSLKPSPTSRPLLPSSIVNNQGQMSNSNTTTDVELQTLSEDLLSKDTNNAARLITINYQGKTTSQSNEDKAPQPLLTLSPEVWNIPTIQKIVPLLDNYERDTLVNEYVTPQERNEENAFMDAIMSTSVIRHLMNFLKDKGYVTPDPRQQRDFLKQLWFGLYSRGKGKISSSGFEHVFVSELKNGEVIGLHNWIYFAKEEAANRVNYLGYMRYSPFSNKGVLIKLHMTQQGVNKPVNGLFIGTSPELEMALYTLCFVTRPDGNCKLKLGGNDVDINTYIFRYRSKNYIGTAYPVS